MVYVCVMIWKQGLVKSTGSMYEGRLKILIVYFARIVLTEILLWIPGSLVYLVSWRLDEINSTKVLAYNWAIVFSGSQVIVSFGFSLTKPDARKLISDLLKCAYCCNCYKDDSVGGCCERVAEGDDAGGKSCYYDDPYLRSCLPTTMISSICRTSKFSKQFPGRQNNESNTIDDGQPSQINTNDVLDSPHDSKTDRNTTNCLTDDACIESTNTFG